jgi:5-formyltetrahydrofolate cyclo-ligase
MRYGIWFEPIMGEPDPKEIPFSHLMADRRIILPTSKTSNPILEGKKITTSFQSNEVYLLIPGRKFDLHGTRHGKGYGWFDRFLSIVPPEWIRIGVCHAKQINKTPLTRATWDQPVDWVIVQNDEAWSAHETVARTLNRRTHTNHPPDQR